MAYNVTVAARILRVNHGGEHGAIQIYRAQIAMARLRAPDLLPFLEEALSHEIGHRRRFRDLMPTRDAKPCRLMWIWGIGGAALGTLTGAAGRDATLACTEAVERTVHRHLDQQIAWAKGRDEELRCAIREIQTEEEEHLRFAVAGREGGASPNQWLEVVISYATESLIWLSTRGDSTRLAHELARAEAR